MVSTIELSGELDVLARPDIEAAVEEALADPVARRLVLDVRDVSFIDSAAIYSTFVMARQKANGVGSTFHVLPSAVVRRALELTGLDDVLRDATPNLSPDATEGPFGAG
jgi:anti-anti-sigma factor